MNKFRNGEFVILTTIMVSGAAFSAPNSYTPSMNVPQQIKPASSLRTCVQQPVKFVLKNNKAQKIIVSKSGNSARVRWEVIAEYSNVNKVQLRKRQGTPINVVGRLVPNKAVFEASSANNTHAEGGLAELHVWGNKGCGTKDVYLKYQIRLPKGPSAKPGSVTVRP